MEPIAEPLQAQAGNVESSRVHVKTQHAGAGIRVEEGLGVTSCAQGGIDICSAFPPVHIMQNLFHQDRMMRGVIHHLNSKLFEDLLILFRQRIALDITHETVVVPDVEVKQLT